MLYVDQPTPKDIGNLNLVRSDACISIYLRTTPLTQEIGESRNRLGQMVKTAINQLEAAGLEKRRIWPVQERFDDLIADDDFWAHQAHSLAILATPDSLHTWRLSNELIDIVEVSDRFHLKPLLRAVTFPHSAYVLAVSENAVRLIEVSSDLPAVEVRVAKLPKDAASAVGKASINDSGTGRRIQNMEGQKIRLAQYIRKIDAALRPVLAQSDIPVILAATLPVSSLFRAISALPLLPQTIEGSPDRLSADELAQAARPVMDTRYQSQIDDFHRVFEVRTGESRTTTDISDAARAATFGGIDSMLIDFDSVTSGRIDAENGAVTFEPEPSAKGYGVIDEIVGRALRSGAYVMAVRKQDLPGEGALAAILRYPV